MWRAAWRSFLAHKLRLASTGLAIVLGVGFVTGSLILTDTISATFNNLFEQVDAGISVEVQAVNALATGNATGAVQPMPQSVLAKVKAVPGVADAVGGVGGVAVILDKHGKAIAPSGPPTLGFSYSSNSTLSGLTLRSGHGPDGPDQFVMDAATAARYGFHIGDRVRVVTDQPARSFLLVGTVGLGTSNSLAGATLAAFQTPTAQQLFGLVGRYDTVDVQAAAGVSPTDLRARMANALGPGFRVRTGTQTATASAASITNGLKFLTILLLVFAGVALVVGSFLIANTFSIIVTQRTRELGLLRALGAERSQVMRAVLVEAGLTAVLASGVGILAGLGMEALVVGILSRSGASIPAQGRVIELRTIIVALAVGVVVTMLAALGPARRATRVPPLAALRETTVIPASARRWRQGVGAVLLALGALGLVVGAAVASAGRVGLGAVLTLAGLLLLGAQVAPRLADAIGAVPARLFGVTGRLARRNAVRVPARTAANANSLMIGVALVGLLSVVAASAAASANALVDDLFAANYLVQGVSFEGIPPGVTSTLSTQPAVASVGEVRSANAKVGLTKVGITGLAKVGITGLNAAAVPLLSLRMTAGSFSPSAGSGLLVSQATAKAQRYRVGEVIPIIYPRGASTVRITGVYEDNQVVGSWAMPLGEFETRFPAANFDDEVLVKLRPGASAVAGRQVVSSITRAYPSVKVENKAQLEAQQRANVNGILSLFTALLLLALIIAFLGIANTLALSILERTREIGILRALGMQRRTVRSVVRWESVILSAVGALEGLVLGVVIGVAVIVSLRTQGVHVLVVPWVRLLVYLVVACVLGTVAAVLPARRAAKLKILSAIASTD